MREIHLVVARYKESIEWLENLSLPDYVKVIIYNKGDEIVSTKFKTINLPNLGQCW